MTDDIKATKAAALMRQVRQAMVDQDVNQSELARRAGLSRSYVSLLFNDRVGETNRRTATLPTALMLAEALGILQAG